VTHTENKKRISAGGGFELFLDVLKAYGKTDPATAEWVSY
jgi:hypothetical protein